MTTNTSYPRTQAEFDEYMAQYKLPTRNTYEGMFPLHDDFKLSDEQVQIVLDYVKEVDFHLPGATSDDFVVVRWARYVGFQFLSEDLEAYAIGLRCTRPGMEDQNTFIRMSWGQLMGHEDAPRLPVNEPVLACDTLVLNKYRDTRTGPSRTGVDSYATDEGEPGVDFDLKLLYAALDDVIAHHATGDGLEYNTWWNPALMWGTAMAGRYPRLKYFQSKGRLTDAQEKLLKEFEECAEESKQILDDLALAQPAPVAAAALKQAKKAEKGGFRSRLRIANPTPLTESKKA